MGTTCWCYLGVQSQTNIKTPPHLSKNELFITDLDNSTIGLQGVLNRMMDTIEHQHSELHHHLIQELQLDPKFYGKNGGWLVWWLFGLLWLLFVVVVGVVVVCSSCLYCSYCSYCSYIVRSVRIIRVYSHNFLTPSSFFFLTLIQACGGSLHCWPVNLTCRIVCGCGIPSLRTSTKRKLWNF